MKTIPEEFLYDVFLSYNHKDESIVRDLARRLIADGLRVWLDEWEIQPGDTIGLKTEQGLSQSRILILFMSSNAFSSKWVTLERQTVLFRDPNNSHRRFIPILLDDTDIKDVLKQFNYIDWRNEDTGEYDRLLSACRAAIDDSTKEVSNDLFLRDSKVLIGHAGFVRGLLLTPDNKEIITSAHDGTIRLWDIDSGEHSIIFKNTSLIITEIAILPDGEQIVFGLGNPGEDTLQTWNTNNKRTVSTFAGHQDIVFTLALTPDNTKIISGSKDGDIRVWDVRTSVCLGVLQGHNDLVFSILVTPDGQRIVSSSWDGTIRVWDIKTSSCLLTLKQSNHFVFGIALTSDGKRIISGSADNTVQVWDLETGHCLSILEGHTDNVIAVAVTSDGKRIVSGSGDKTIRVWDMETGYCLLILEGHTSLVYKVAITSDDKQIVSCSNDYTIRIWNLPTHDGRVSRKNVAARYTNAKVLLVGETGVGKSGLSIRLTENRFEPTISSDAVWATQLNLPHGMDNDEIEREIWLWDFAGQADYKLIHQLFMDETSLAVLVFNPQSENPFEGLSQWDYDLQRAARRPFEKLLVAGRCDRGGTIVSRTILEEFRQTHNFIDYLETSASTGAGCDELRKSIIDNIVWNDIPWTASPHVFKILKEEIVKLKDEGKSLLRMSELKQQLEMRLPDTIFTVEQLRAVVGLLAGPGVVWKLNFGDFVLLQPERINSYAAAMIRKVRAHIEEIGVISEEDVLAGRLDFQDMKRLPLDEEQIVLRAMHQTCVDHSLCLRESTEAGMLLIFPSYFKRERPDLENHPAVFVTYNFNGSLEEIYSTLVVRLSHTSVFEKDQFWKFAADFKTQIGKRIGLKMNKRGEGSAELSIYCDISISDDLKVTFIRYVHDHLKIKANNVVRLRHYVCPHCGTSVENRKTALERLGRGLKDIVCVDCENRIVLWDLIEQKFASEELQEKIQTIEEEARISMDNESKELILVGHAFAIAGEAGQIFRPTSNSDWGIDGEIEFKNDRGQASGNRVYLQLKSGDSYLRRRKTDDKDIFTIPNQRQADYWQEHRYPVMLVIRTSDGQIRWMNITEYLNTYELTYNQKAKHIIFEGEPFTALNLVRLRDKSLRHSLNG